ncbi:MAG: hypothetical protein JST30_04290 [Armatimonadetes bacterium]|nr:hypothetical protein [Armatimonadota bacterium]
MKAVLCSALLAALLASGCGKTLAASDLAGNWEGTVVVPDAELLKQLKAMGKSDKDLPEFKKAIESNKYPMELHPDMTFTFGSGLAAASGSWTFKNPTLTLTIDKARGMKVEDIVKQAPQMKDEFKPMVMTASADGGKITGSLPNPGGQSVSVTFVKAKG